MNFYRLHEQIRNEDFFDEASFFGFNPARWYRVGQEFGTGTGAQAAEAYEKLAPEDQEKVKGIMREKGFVDRNGDIVPANLGKAIQQMQDRKGLRGTGTGSLRTANLPGMGY